MPRYKTKEVECYRCGRKGVAKLKPNPNSKKDKTWQAEGFGGFKKVSRGERWVCKRCQDFRCEKCGVLLSKDFYKKMILERVKDETKKELVKKELKEMGRINYGYYTKSTLPYCRDCWRKSRTQK